MKKRLFIITTAIIGFLLLDGGVLSAASKIFDTMESKGKWQAYTDKTPVAKITVVPGPKGHKALQMEYQFEEGQWIAMVKITNFSLNQKEKIRFSYMGTGASVCLKIKIADESGAVFGYKVGGSLSPEWQEVSIPVSELTYLWGGTDADSMDWNKLAKFEFTLDLEESSEGDYSINKDHPGKLMVSQIEFIK